MTDETAKKPEYSSLYRPQPPYLETPFDSSAFDQKAFASRIAQAIELLSQGAVIAIDAPWGLGKTYFGRNLNADLKANGWKTVYIDAFQNDFIEDPFLLLASALKEPAGDSKQVTFLKAAVSVGKVLLPITAKAIAKVASGGLVDADVAGDAAKVISDAAGDAAAKLIESRIADFDKDKRSIEAFVKVVGELAQSVQDQTSHPLVVFVDELDRCRPDFAVRMLERMKHFFDVPHLVFILLLNKPQLENAVNGVYGVQLDAQRYLQKFIHITFQLPVRLKREEHETTELSTYPEYLSKKVTSLDAERARMFDAFVSTMSELAPGLHLSFRDIERCFTTFLVLGPKQKTASILVSGMTFVLVLKVVFPGILERVLQRDESVMDTISDLLRAAAQRGLSKYSAMEFDAIVKDHFNVAVPDEMKDLFKQYRMVHIQPGGALRFMASFFDSRLSRR